MKVYKTIEDGNHCYYGNHAEAKKCANNSHRMMRRGENEGHSEKEGEKIEVPTTKKGLIEWLNVNASTTGFSIMD